MKLPIFYQILCKGRESEGFFKHKEAAEYVLSTHYSYEYSIKPVHIEEFNGSEEAYMEAYDESSDLQIEDFYE